MPRGSPAGRCSWTVRPAHDALAAEVGGKLGLAAEMAALGVVEMVDENMANAARVTRSSRARPMRGAR